MASVNKVILLGRLGRDPKTSDAQGLAICRLALATTRRYKGRDGEKKEETEWHNAVVFGRQAEVAQQYLVKGSEVYIEGRLHTRKYTGKDGIERYATEVVCESMQLGAKPTDGAQGSGAPAGFESPERSTAPQGQGMNDEIPF